MKLKSACSNSLVSISSEISPAAPVAPVATSVPPSLEKMSNYSSKYDQSTVSSTAALAIFLKIRSNYFFLTTFRIIQQEIVSLSMLGLQGTLIGQCLGYVLGAKVCMNLLGKYKKITNQQTPSPASIAAPGLFAWTTRAATAVQGPEMVKQLKKFD